MYTRHVHGYYGFNLDRMCVLARCTVSAVAAIVASPLHMLNCKETDTQNRQGCYDLIHISVLYVCAVLLHVWSGPADQTAYRNDGNDVSTVDSAENRATLNTATVHH
jgi:hypothetical protein